MARQCIPHGHLRGLSPFLFGDQRCMTLDVFSVVPPALAMHAYPGRSIRASASEGVAALLPATITF